MLITIKYLKLLVQKMRKEIRLELPMQKPMQETTMPNLLQDQVIITRLLLRDTANIQLLQKRDQTSRLTNAKHTVNPLTRVTLKDIGGNHTEEDIADAASLLII